MEPILTATTKRMPPRKQKTNKSLKAKGYKAADRTRHLNRQATQNQQRERLRPKRKRYNAPAAVGVSGVQTSPSYSGKGGTLCVRHSEYFCDVVTAAAAINATSCQIQPGLPVATYGTSPQVNKGPFTWLPNIANNYERYRVKRMSFRFEPQCASTSAGMVAMYVDYDAGDTPAATKATIMNMDGCSRGVNWVPQTLRVQHPQMLKWLLTRPGAINTSTSYIEYDVGTINVFTLDGTAATTIGSVFVDYEIEFSTPKTA